MGVWLDSTLAILQRTRRSAGKGALERLDVLYHLAIRFTTNAPYRTHHCTLYSSVNWSSLYTRRKTHWFLLIYKTLLGLTPPYLRYLLQPSFSTYNTSSASHILIKVPQSTHIPGSLLFSVHCSYRLERAANNQTGQFYLNLFFQRLNHGHSY